MLKKRNTNKTLKDVGMACQKVCEQGRDDASQGCELVVCFRKTPMHV